jgi:hypothetical protein
VEFEFRAPDFVLSPRHLLNFNVSVLPKRTEFANINSLVPQSASSNYGPNGVAASVSDAYQIESGASSFMRSMNCPPEAWGIVLNQRLGHRSDLVNAKTKSSENSLKM